MSAFYVYWYCEPTVPRGYTRPFYIGKGRGKRAYVHLSRCQCRSDKGYDTFFYRKLRKLLAASIQPKIEIVADNLTEKRAFEIESLLIHYFGRRDTGQGPLCNLTDGGNLPGSGRVCTAETRQLLSRRLTGRKRSLVTCERIGNSKRGVKLSATTRVKMSVAHRRSVGGFDCDGNRICQFDSIKLTALDGYTPSCVSNCLAGRQKTHRQLVWQYIEGEEQ